MGIFQNVCFFFSCLTLIFSFLSLWLQEKRLLWMLFLIVSLTLAALTGHITLKELLPLALLYALHLLLTLNLQGFKRALLLFAASALSIAFLSPLFKPHLFDYLQLPHKPPFKMHYLEPFVGLFPLALSIPLLSRMHLRSVLLKTLMITSLSLFLFALLYSLFFPLEISLKLPLLTPLWLLALLFFQVIPQEAFYRGFLQREIIALLSTKRITFLTILALSLLAALIEQLKGQNTPLLIFSLYANCVSGILYQTTRSLESSIFCHFLFKALYFLIA